MTAPSSNREEIPGIPATSQHKLEQVFVAEPLIDAAWLFGSRAMNRFHQGSDIDLCLDGDQLSHPKRLALMAVIDDLLLPWQVDLVLRRELPPELQAHLSRVGRCIWRRD